MGMATDLTEATIQTRLAELERDDPIICWCPYHGTTCTGCGRMVRIHFNSLPDSYAGTQYAHDSDLRSPKWTYARNDAAGWSF